MLHLWKSSANLDLTNISRLFDKEEFSADDRLISKSSILLSFQLIGRKHRPKQVLELHAALQHGFTDL
jgi:hypothetical protein